jgi:hypothetical protein
MYCKFWFEFFSRSKLSQLSSNPCIRIRNRIRIRIDLKYWILIEIICGSTTLAEGVSWLCLKLLGPFCYKTYCNLMHRWSIWHFHRDRLCASTSPRRNMLLTSCNCEPSFCLSRRYFPFLFSFQVFPWFFPVYPWPTLLVFWQTLSTRIP